MAKAFLTAAAAVLVSTTLVQAQSPPVVLSTPAGAPVAYPGGSLASYRATPVAYASGSPAAFAGLPVASTPGSPPIDETAPVTHASDSPLYFDPHSGPEYREKVWFQADYLLWWIRNGPISTPLVTTGSPGDAVPGALGQPNTVVLFGDKSLDFSAFSGVRLGVGFDLGQGWAIEGSYFGLERRVADFTLNSDPNGNPVIARPIFDNQAGTTGAYLDALPDTLAGGVSVSAQSRLQSYELNLAIALLRDPSLSFELLSGFRTLELIEDLRIVDNVTALAPGLLTFTGGPAVPPSSLTVFDHFRTYTHFYGGQVGGRVQWHFDRFDLGATGKLALGATQRLVLIDGVTSLNTPDTPPTTNVGGILAQPSNSGRFFQSAFGVIPEIGLDAGYWLTPQLRLSFGYEFLYWNRVARPGNQLDPNVNPAQVPRDPNFGNGLGDPRPAFQFHTSAFWAQGFHFGLTYQY
jgi:hypothetical protein